MTQHIFLSPHLDDVALSCGGTLIQLVNQGATVKVINVFAGIPDSDLPLSSFARYQHEQWQSLQQAYLIRRTEDEVVLARFNLKPVWLDFLDCIYRGQPDRGVWYYTSDKDIFGSIHPAEADLPAQIFEAIQPYLNVNDGQTVLYVPLGVGNHVDHQLTFLAAIWFWGHRIRFNFYEEYPYIQRNPAYLIEAKQNCQQQLLKQLNGPVASPFWQAKLNHLTEDELAAKIDFVAAYASQMQMLFGGPDVMRQHISAYAYEAGEGQIAERFWIINER
jgi:LmbE family N-acetylglucosaminyl deacetylase